MKVVISNKRTHNYANIETTFICSYYDQVDEKVEISIGSHAEKQIDLKFRVVDKNKADELAQIFSIDLDTIIIEIDEKLNIIYELTSGEIFEETFDVKF